MIRRYVASSEIFEQQKEKPVEVKEKTTAPAEVNEKPAEVKEKAPAKKKRKKN